MAGEPRIEIVPSAASELNFTFLDREGQLDQFKNGWIRAWSAFHDRVIEERGDIVFSDLSDVPRKRLSKMKRLLPGNSARCDKSWVIAWNLPHYVHSDKFLRIPSEKVVLFLLEPPTVIEGQYSHEKTKHFSKVFTWRDDLVDGKHYIKFYHPVLRPAMDEFAFSEKKLMCMIFANKSSTHSDELYSKRRAIIEHFDHHDDFDLYGHGWEKEGYESYCGMVESKFNTANRYRFSFCLENCKNQPGYITEKIFDAFSSLSVPIYEGAPNIADEVPKECFIDLNKFSSLDELYTYLSTMSEDEYQGYINSIKKFLKSPEAQKFSAESFEKLLEEHLL